MRRILGVLVFVASASLPLAAQSSPDPSIVRASGNGLVELPADYAVVVFGVAVEADRPDSAAAEMSRRIDSVTAALGGLGIPQDSLPTSRLAVRSRSRTVAGLPVTRYEATSLLRLRVWRLDQVPAVLGAALQAGATTIENLDYRSAHEQEGRDNAVRLATEEANRHARLMAEAQGLELVRPLSTTFSQRAIGFDRNLAVLDAVLLSASRDGGLTPGEIVPIGVSISVQVQVEWEARQDAS